VYCADAATMGPAPAPDINRPVITSGGPNISTSPAAAKSPQTLAQSRRNSEVLPRPGSS